MKTRGRSTSAMISINPCTEIKSKSLKRISKKIKSLARVCLTYESVNID